MAEHMLDSRILLRYDTYSAWMNSNVILKQGETAVAAFPRENSLPPLIGIKIGDGQHYFSELPWVLAVASDVYNWAKQSTPPSAENIPGLAEYIEAHTGSGSSSSGTAYQIIYDNSNKKYILQVYDEETETWLNTSSEINLSSILNRLSTIERWANGDTSNLGNINESFSILVQDVVLNILGRVNNTDEPVENLFVTSVSQSNGKISVTRKALSTSNISGIFSTAQGGTGFTEVYADEILIGSSSGNLVKTNIARILNEDETNNIPTSGAVINYVNRATIGLTGAMHFIGEATVAITTANLTVDPLIAGYNFSLAKAGDVILANNALEYVWTNGYWRLLGDEGSYAVKGSITNADISDEAGIALSKILNLAETFDTKVDKEDGKTLTSNDYINEDKLKLANIEDGAQRNTIEYIYLNNVNQIPHVSHGLSNVIDLTISEFDTASLAKLNSIEENAEVNIIESISINDEPLIIDENKNVNIIINEFTTADKLKLDSIESGAQVNIIESILMNSTTITITNKSVDLSIREYPQADEEKLLTIDEGAQINRIEHIKIDDVEIVPDNNKTVSITTNPHTEHENVIEGITINGITYSPDANKIVNIRLDQAALDLSVIEGAIIPDGAGSTTSVPQIDKKLSLETIAVTGDVKDLRQTANTYIILDCGTSDNNTHPIIN